MERRDVLKLGAAAALTGCAVPATTFRAVPPPPAWTPETIADALADLDATLDKMAALKPRPELFVGERTLDAKRAARGHDLVVRTLAAMHVAATLRELPPEVQAREEVQRKVWQSLPMIDAAMLDMNDYVTQLTPADRRAIQEQLRNDPSAGMNAIGKLDEHAAAAGVSNRRRMQMRAIATHLSWRMTKQSVDATLEDTLDKVRRISERHGRDEETRRLIAAKVAEAELFGAHANHPAHAIFSVGVPDNEERSRRASHTLGVGAVLLGIGAVTAGVGTGLVVGFNSGNDGGAFAAGLVMITIGAALGLAGIITLIVGAVMSVNASQSSTAEEQNARPVRD